MSVVAVNIVLLVEEDYEAEVKAAAEVVLTDIVAMIERRSKVILENYSVEVQK